ncbi:unnamed protein product, partial [Iphiclides podalirius]
MMIVRFSYTFFLVVIMITSDIATVQSAAPKIKRCSRRSITYENEELVRTLKDMVLPRDSLQPDALNMDADPANLLRKGYGGLFPLPIMMDDEILRSIDEQKAFACSQLQCAPSDNLVPVCACNYNTGNVVTFKSECDTKKHNCRFDTAFHVILNEICPWEFQSRRDSGELVINYDDPKYYN